MAKSATKKAVAKTAKKTTKKTTAKKKQNQSQKAAPKVEDKTESQPVLEVVADEMAKEDVLAVQPIAAQKEENTVSVKLSEALYKKLVRSAEDEGIDLDSFVTELLAEGVVLRAFEIVERKNAMRGDSAPNGNNAQGGNFNRGNNGNNRHRNNRQQRRGNQQNQNGNWMDDRASFLEYVRNQEKRQR